MPSADLLAFENIWTVSIPATGVTVTANYAIGTASGNTLVGLLNPAGNPVPLYIKRAAIIVVTGTMVTGGFVWGVSPASQASVITTSGIAAVNNLYMVTVTHTLVAGAGAPAPRGISFAGDTTSGVLGGTTAASIKLLRPFAGGAVAGALAAGAMGVLVEDLQGEITVGPGCFAGLFPAAGATALLAQATITWTEGP